MNDRTRDRDARSQAEQFWEGQYQKGPRPWTGRPNAILSQWVEGLTPGSALDLGCSEGNSAVWLARRGWRVTGVDVSATALSRAATHAAEAGVADRTAFEQHDLGQTFPEGEFDLVYALYLQSPVTFPQGQVLRAAAAAVTPGGLLLVVEHASVAPWSWAAPDTIFPPPEQVQDALELPTGQWRTEFVGAPERQLTGPGGQVATVTDNVLAVRRLAK